MYVVPLEQHFEGGVTWIFTLYLRNRSCDIWIHGWEVGEVELVADWGLCALVPQQEIHAYRGRLVLYTLSKDNDVTWIIDWIRFNVVNHGTDAVLLYDHRSTR